jgi:hypothetical protein
VKHPLTAIVTIVHPAGSLPSAPRRRSLPPWPCP